MPKIVWISNSRKGQRKGNFLQKFFDWFGSLDKFIKLALITMLIISVVTPVIITSRFDLLGRASSNKTGTINVTPSTGSYTVGTPFTVNLVIDGGGITFNAARANVSVSTNLSVQSLSITAPTSGGCNFVFANQKATPTTSDPSFAGAILNNFSLNCTIYTLTLMPLAPGAATLVLTNGSIKAYTDHSEILLSTQNGTFNINSSISPTPQTTPTLTPVPTTFITLTPTPTPIPQATLTPTPTQSPLSAPTINTLPVGTYLTSMLLTGTKTNSITSVYVNNQTNTVTYPTSTTWQVTVSLSLGYNIFSVYGQDSLGNKSPTNSANTTLHKLGDINGDGVVDLTDLSMFATDWENTGTLNYPLSDMDGDGVVDLTDFSIIAKAYGN